MTDRLKKALAEYAEAQRKRKPEPDLIDLMNANSDTRYHARTSNPSLPPLAQPLPECPEQDPDFVLARILEDYDLEALRHPVNRSSRRTTTSPMPSTAGTPN